MSLSMTICSLVLDYFFIEIDIFLINCLKIKSLGINLNLSDFMPKKEDEEFTVLASCLGLLPSFQSAHQFTSASCLDWPVPAFDMISQWCSELTSFAGRHPDQVKVCSKVIFSTIVMIWKQLFIASFILHIHCCFG